MNMIYGMFGKGSLGWLVGWLVVLGGEFIFLVSWTYQPLEDSCEIKKSVVIFFPLLFLVSSLL